jgi:hypothetical protein
MEKIAASKIVAKADNIGCIPPKLWRLTYIQLVPANKRPSENANEVLNTFIGLCVCKIKNNNAQVAIGRKKMEKGANPRTVSVPSRKA